MCRYGDVQRSVLIPRPVLLRMRAILDAAISSSSLRVSASSSSSTCFCIALMRLVHSARPDSGFVGMLVVRWRVPASPRSILYSQERGGSPKRRYEIERLKKTYSILHSETRGSQAQRPQNHDDRSGCQHVKLSKDPAYPVSVHPTSSIIVQRTIQRTLCFMM